MIFGHHANAITHGSVQIFWSIETNVRSLTRSDSRVSKRSVIICAAAYNSQPAPPTQTRTPTEGIVSKFVLNVLNPNDFNVSVR